MGTWPPVPGSSQQHGRLVGTAIITCNHGDCTIRKREAHRGGVKRRQPTEPGDTMSFKHKGDATRWRWWRRGRSGRRGKEPYSLFAALSALFYPFLCHLTLPSSHLQAASALSLSSPLLWFYPLSIPIHFLYCVRHPLRYGGPSSFPQPTMFCHSLALPLHPQALSGVLLSFYQTSLLFHLALSIKMETHFSVLSVLSDSATNMRLHASVNNVCTNWNKSEGLQRQCPCSTLSFPGAPLLRESLICEGFICTKPLLQTLLP